jgi:hypothetical protein
MGAIEGEESGIEFIEGATCSRTKEMVTVDGRLPLGIEGIEGAFTQSEGLRNKDG